MAPARQTGKVKKKGRLPVILVAQETHRESGLLFDAVMKTGQSGSMTWTHQRMTAVQSWMRQQARRKPFNEKRRGKDDSS